LNLTCQKKIRQRVDIPLGPEGETHLSRYNGLMKYADDVIAKTMRGGGTLAEAKKAAIGLWCSARESLVEAKIADGAVADCVC